MKTTTGTHRPRAAQRAQAIIETARSIAETEGWEAVTVRRLATAIGYSQPVLYQHFPDGRREIVAAVSRAGFAGLREALAQQPRGALAAAAHSYVEFASEHPALYEAMFHLQSHTRFASVETPEELRASFDALAELLDDRDESHVRTELFWSALHGLATLERDGRLPTSRRDARIAELARVFA